VWISLQSTLEDDPEADGAQMEILLKRTLYDLCGFYDGDDGDDSEPEIVVSWQIVR
jgi:hypothetical protein